MPMHMHKSMHIGMHMHTQIAKQVYTYFAIWVFSKYLLQKGIHI